jgi:hypothetical protein
MPLLIANSGDKPPMRVIEVSIGEQALATAS